MASARTLCLVNKDGQTIQDVQVAQVVNHIAIVISSKIYKQQQYTVQNVVVHVLVSLAVKNAND